MYFSPWSNIGFQHCKIGRIVIADIVSADMLQYSSMERVLIK
jgi:hypothetical protein